MTSIWHTRLPVAFTADDLILATLLFRFMIDAQIFRFNHFFAGKMFIKKNLVNEKKSVEKFYCNCNSTVSKILNDFQFNEV